MAMPALREIATGHVAACHYPMTDPAGQPQPLAAVA
jgi:hypothetical protein